MSTATPLEYFLDRVGLLLDKQSALHDLGVKTVDDLRFIFASLEEADLAGLGHQWQAVANCGSGTCSKALPFIEIPKVHHWPRFAPLKLRSIVRRGRFKAAATPGADLEGRAVLAKQALQLSVDWRPKFGLASEITHLTDAWLDRNVQSLSRFEPRVVKSALLCWEAWCAWCDLKCLSTFCFDPMAWEDFIFGRSSAPTMPRTTWSQAKWLVDRLKAPIPIEKISKPGRRPKEGSHFVDEEEQTPVADPELLAFLEAQVVVMQKCSDFRLGVVLAALVEAYGGARHMHMSRARLVAISDIAVKAVVFRGKRRTAGGRPAFKFHFPIVGITGIRFGEILWEHWNRLSKCAGGPIYSIVLDLTTGSSIPIGKFNDILTEVCAPMLLVRDNAKVRVTSYWLRSVGATLADLRRAPWHERLPLGDWAQKKNSAQTIEGGENLMPLRYSRSKVASEIYVKLLHVLIMNKLLAVVKPPVVWEGVREAVETMDLALLRTEVARAMDGEVEGNLAFGHEDLPLSYKTRKTVQLVKKRPLVVTRLLSKQLAITNTITTQPPVAEDVVSTVAVGHIEPLSQSELLPIANGEPEQGVDPYSQYTWMAGGAARSVVHFGPEGGGDIPICNYRRKRAKPSAVNVVTRGDDVRDSFSAGKFFCTACLGVLPKEVVTSLKADAPHCILHC